MTVTATGWWHRPALAAVALAVPVAAWIVWVEGLEQNLRESLPKLALIMLAYGAYEAFRLVRRRHRRKGRFPLELSPQGMGFGRGPLVAWSEVEGVDLRDDGWGLPGIGWRLRGGSEVLYHGALSRRPETIVASARAYLRDLAAQTSATSPGTATSTDPS